MATQVVELTGDEASLLRSLQKVIDKERELERKLRDAAGAGDAAGTSIEAALAKIQGEADKSLRGFMGDLRSLGPEGAAAAEAMKGHFVGTGKAGFQSMEQVLDQIRKLDPEAADAAEAAGAKIRDELGRAAQYSEGKFADVLDELRKAGPEGKQAADQLRKHLVSAGEIAEKSMHDIVAELEKISPEAAKAGRAIVSNIEEGDSMFKNFGKNAVAEITAMAGAYIGVQEAVQVVNDYLQSQRDLIREAAEAQKELAKSQQDATKNLSALSPDERKALLAAAPGIAQQSGFGDISAITDALGTVASTGLNDPAKIADIVRQTARLERLTPENLAASAAGAADVMSKTGLQDIREALALISDTGAESLVGDPAKLAANLPKALAAAAATAPNQAKSETARQGAAIFAQATVVGDDAMGNSSATFTIDLLTRMDKFFSDLSEEQVKARSKIELIDRKIEKGKDTEADRLNKGKLSDFLTASEGITDPGTIFGRLQILQQSATLASQFQGESGFGEKQFQPFLKALLDGQSETATNVNSAFGRIGASVDKFETVAKEIQAGTPQAVIATADAQLKGTIAASQVGNTEGAALSKVREIAVETAKQTSGGITDYFASFGLGSGILPGSTAAEEGLASILRMESEIANLQADSVTQQEAAKIQTLQSGITNTSDLLLGLSSLGAISPSGANQARNRLTSPGGLEQGIGEFLAVNPEVFNRLATLLETIAANTQNAAKAGETTATNTTPRQPAATPALSAQQP